MLRTFEVALLVGSLGKKSVDRKIAAALSELAPASLHLNFVEIGGLPLYDPDMDSNPTPAWKQFREKIGSADAVLFVTQELHASVPGLLKNAIDGGGRTNKSNVWNNKPGAIITVSSSGIGDFESSRHLRESLVFLNVPTMMRPKAVIGNADRLIDANGKLIDFETRQFLKTYLLTFAEWVAGATQGL